MDSRYSLLFDSHDLDKDNQDSKEVFHNEIADLPNNSKARTPITIDDLAKPIFTQEVDTNLADNLIDYKFSDGNKVDGQNESELIVGSGESHRQIRFLEAVLTYSLTLC